MTRKNLPTSYLRLVVPVRTGNVVDSPQERQLRLFANVSPALLGLVLLDGNLTSALTTILMAIRPKYVVDVRPFPAFDHAGTSRRSVFRTIDQLNSRYLDAMGALGVIERRHAAIHSGALSHFLSINVGSALMGPLVFLFDSEEEVVTSSSVLPKTLRPMPSPGWQVKVFRDAATSP